MAWRIVDYGVHALLVASGAHLIRHFRRNDRPIKACLGALRMRNLALNSRNRKAVGRRRLACCRLKRVESFCWLGTEPETSSTGSLSLVGGERRMVGLMNGQTLLCGV
jgi:hypothetical protein